MTATTALHVSGTSIHVLDTAKKYFTEVLRPEYEDFFGSAATLRGAFNLANAIFHFHEWLYEDYRTELGNLFRRPLKSAGELWVEVQATDPRFGFIRDLANSAKHVRLTRNPSTSITHVANTSIQVGAFDSSAFDRKTFDVSSVKMKDGATDIAFDDCAKSLFEYWDVLLGKMP
jgi:hypothetical protein